MMSTQLIYYYRQKHHTVIAHWVIIISNIYYMTARKGKIIYDIVNITLLTHLRGFNINSRLINIKSHEDRRAATTAIRRNNCTTANIWLFSLWFSAKDCADEADGMVMLGALLHNNGSQSSRMQCSWAVQEFTVSSVVESRAKGAKLEWMLKSVWESQRRGSQKSLVNFSRNYANDNCYAHFGRVVVNPFISFTMTQYAAQGYGNCGNCEEIRIGTLDSCNIHEEIHNKVC